jgi:hypothetical protein
MDSKDYVRDQLVLAEHHVSDAEEAKSPQVRNSSLDDLHEIVDRLAKTLPKKHRESVAHEKLASSQNHTKLTHTEGPDMTTYTANELRKLAEEADARDKANAFELGFAKAAAAAGLTEEQYQHVRNIGIELLAKRAAEMGSASEVVADRKIEKVGPEAKLTKPKKSKGTEKTASDNVFFK